jgi:hypothetical protein
MKLYNHVFIRRMPSEGAGTKKLKAKSARFFVCTGAPRAGYTIISIFMAVVLGYIFCLYQGRQEHGYIFC